MSVMDTLTNPWVLGIGAALGVVLLMRGSAGEDNGASTSALYSPAFLTDQMRTNAALVQTSLQTASVLEGKRIDASTTRDIAALSTLASLANTGAVERSKLAETRNATIRAIATTNAAVVIDQQQNFARLGMTWIASSTEKYKADISLATAKVQAKAIKDKGMFDLIGNVIGTAGKVAMAAI
jgi:hypothetical protein